MTYSNKNELCILALQRSGHHAIINWISANQNEEHCFLNNCQTGINPYLGFARQDSHIGNIKLDEEIGGKFSSKKLFIYNYEDKTFTSIFSSLFIKNRAKWIGNSESSVNIIILRDPFNNFASKYKWVINGTKWVPSLQSIQGLPALWKIYAREFLALTNDVPEPKLFINYNKWFSNPMYRQELAKKLSLKSSDLGLKEVAKWGPNTWGDSFDNLNYEGKANEMKVLERWRKFSKDDFFMSLFKDEELQELSKNIFGTLPGTENF